MEFFIAQFLYPYPEMPLSNMFLNTSTLAGIPATFCCMNHKRKSVCPATKGPEDGVLQ
jgi:hypothetical protein